HRCSLTIPYTTLFRSGQLEEGAGARELRHQRLQDGLLPRAPRDVAVGRIEHVLANARVDQGAVAAHVLHALPEAPALPALATRVDRKSTRLNSSHVAI